MKRILTILIPCAVLILTGCSKKYDWKNPLDPANDLAPNVAYSQPPNDAQGLDPNSLFFFWWVSDINNGDIVVSCDVYLGSENPPSYIGKANISSLNGDIPDSYEYNALNLQHSAIYYWKIVAWDNHGKSTTGPIWSFTTAP